MPCLYLTHRKLIVLYFSHVDILLLSVVPLHFNIRLMLWAKKLECELCIRLPLVDRYTLYTPHVSITDGGAF